MILLKVLLIGFLVGRVFGQNDPGVIVSTESAPQAEASPDGQVSYVLTYSQNITRQALTTKCENLNCSRIIYGVINALVVTYDPTAVNTLSEDPLLDLANQNIEASLHYSFSANGTRNTRSVLPAWHLDRINQFALPLDGYYANNLTGAGVHIYMLDTGIEANHSEFLSADGTHSRVIANEWSFDGSNNTDDCNGHGTATASLAGGRTLGTAPNATLHAIKAVGCSGHTSIGDIIAALNYIALNHVKPALISMSVGTSTLSEPLQAAVNNTISMFNIPIVASAGNDNTDSCVATPARSVYVAAIGATDINDKRGSFSNRGKCVNTYAPGVNVRCAGVGNTYKFDSGTSMAAPIVAGLAAGYLENDPTLRYFEVNDIIYHSRSRGFSETAAINPPVIQIPLCRSALIPSFANTSRACPVSGYV